MRTRAAMTNVELILARIARDDAGRRMMLSLAALPMIALFWSETCRLARRFEAGQSPFTSSRDYRPVTFLWHHFWIAVHETFGMTGLHVFFGTLLAGVAGVFAVSWARHRAIERRVGPEVLRDWQLNTLRAASPELADLAVKARAPRPRRSSGGLGAVLRLVVWLVPVAAVALTLALVWAALAR